MNHIGLIDYTNIDSIYHNIVKNTNEIDNWFIDFLKFKGAQGVVGILDPNKVNDEEIEKNKSLDQFYVFKIGKYLDFTISNEDIVMNSTNKLRKYLPHFCISLGKHTVSTSSYYYLRKNNPFKKKEIDMDIIILELINGTDMTPLVIKMNTNELISCIKQLLLSIDVAQNKFSLTHYDLHTSNILIKECNPNSIFVYVINGKNYAIPTYGKLPVIIDFGFSYVKNQKKKPLYNSMEHTNSGYLACLFDRIRDPMTLLIGIDYDLTKMKIGGYKKFHKMVMNLFGSLNNVNWENGRDDKSTCSAIQFITYTLGDQVESRILKRHLSTFLTMVQSLIKLPLINNNESDVQPNLIGAFQSFQKEFEKIEQDTKDEFNLLYIIRKIVDILRMSRYEYIEHPREVISYLRKQLHDTLAEIMPFYELPNNLNYEVIIESLVEMADAMEYIFYQLIDNIKKTKNRTYQKLEFQFPYEIFDFVDELYPTDFSHIVDENLEIYYWNTDEEEHKYIQLNNPNIISQIKNKNMSSEEAGNYLYNTLYNKVSCNKQ